MPYLNPTKNIEPRLRSFKYLGDNRVEVSYEWIVNDTLETDYHCFVHGVSKTGDDGEGIIFQQDHALPKPTNQWHKGETIVDGPYEIRIPAKENAYDLAIGLYRGSAGVVVGREGCQQTAFCSPGWPLKRQGDKITDITAEKVKPESQRKGQHEGRFCRTAESAGHVDRFWPGGDRRRGEDQPRLEPARAVPLSARQGVPD